MLEELGFRLTGGGATFDAIQPQYVFRPAEWCDFAGYGIFD